MISNINYMGELLSSSSSPIPFRRDTPQMFVKRCGDHFTLVLFKSGKCRLMGCKRPIPSRVINIVSPKLIINIIRMQSASASFNVNHQLHLGKLGDYCYDNSIEYLFEPELFPALRLTAFNPLCINVFASGKCTILGLRHLCFQKIISRVTKVINRSGCIHQSYQSDDAVKVRKDGFATLQLHTPEAPGLYVPQGRGPTTNPTETVPTSTSETSETSARRRRS